MTEAKASYKRILKSTSIVGGASFLNIAIGIARTKVLAVLLGPSGMGLTSLYSSLMSTAASFSAMGVSTVGTRQIADACSSDDQHKLVLARRALSLAGILLGCAGGLVVWSLRSFLAVHVLGNASYSGAIGWLSVGVALSVVSASQVAAIQGMRRIGDLARLDVLGAAATTVLGIWILWVLGKSGVVFYILTIPAVSIVAGFYYVSKLPKIANESVTFHELTVEWKSLLRIGVAFVAAGLVGDLTQLWIRTDVVKVLGSESLGHYQAAWTISMQYITFILGAMGADYYPRLTALMHEPKASVRLVNEQTEVAMLLGMPVVLAMMALAPWVVHLLYSSSFNPAIEILRWQVLGDVLRLPSWPLSLIILSAGKGKTYFWVESFASIVLAVVIVGLVPILGLRITGISYLVMFVLYLPAVYWLARRQINFRWSRSVARLCLLSFMLSVAVGVIATFSRWGIVVGSISAGAFAVFSVRRIAQMSHGTGAVEMLRTLAARFRTRGGS